jgi:ABC-type glycerol-3-phosphate transport system substrate-binding protein
MTRRTAIALGGAAAALPLVHIRTAGAAGKLNAGFWDPWVPGANVLMQQQISQWADKNKVEVTADFITSPGGKLQLTPAAETQAKAGHDTMTFISWDVQNYAEYLDPVDEQMKRLTAANGDTNSVATYLAKHKGHWMAVPASNGTQTKPPCARISWFKKHGLDLRAMYPAHSDRNAMQDKWTWDELMRFAELAVKDDMTFALGMGSGLNTDGTDMHGALFSAFGAALIDSEGKSQLKSDAVRQVLEFAQRLVKFYPADAVSYDDASNNCALISGKSALIFNPPSAWAVAKRDAPDVAADCWTFPAPTGPKGRFAPFLPYFLALWSFSKNKEAAKSLLTHISQPASIERLVNASGGYDLPAFEKLTTLKVWAEQEPPKGTLYHYPNPHHHQVLSIAASPAPPKIAQQIYAQATLTKMCLKYAQGGKMEDVLAWAEGECEGFMRS